MLFKRYHTERKKKASRSDIDHHLYHSYHPSSPSVGATDTTLGVGDATRLALAAAAGDQSYLDGANTARRGATAPAVEAGAFLLSGACIESYTDVCGGVSARRPFIMPGTAVGVAARLGYAVLVLVRESGRGGDDTKAATGADGMVERLGRAASGAAMSCATRASSAATWSRSLLSRSWEWCHLQ